MHKELHIYKERGEIEQGKSWKMAASNRPPETAETWGFATHCNNPSISIGLA